MWPVLAQLEPPAPSFEYAVVDSCPPEAEAKALFPAAPGRTRVVVWFDGHSFGGTVSFLDPERAPTARTLKGPSCVVVLEALALTMGVAVDDRPEAKPASDDAPEKPEIPEEPEGPPQPPPRKASFFRGVDLGVATWLGSQPMPAIAAGLSIVVGSTREATVWAPRLRFGYVASFPSSVTTKDGTAAFYSFMVRLDACPIELGTHRVLFSPCIRQDTGVLVGTASQDGRRVNDFVAQTGIALLGQFWLEEEGRWYIQADMAGLVPWRRLSYNHPDGPDYFQISPIVGQFGLSVGVSTK
jgi:hypothetical protein